MVQRILDANRLIQAWRGSPPRTAKRAVRLARGVIQRHGSGAIATPVAIEFLGGTRDKEELACARAFLDEFRIVDEG